MAVEIVPITEVTVDLQGLLETYLVTNGSSDLNTVLDYRTYIPDLDNYAQVTLLRHSPDIKDQSQTIRYALVIIFKHDGTETQREAAEDNIQKVITDWTTLLANAKHDKHTVLASTDIESLNQVAQTTTPPAPKYTPDMRWAFVTIQLSAKLWRTT